MQSPPSFALLRQHYFSASAVPPEELWRWIGYPEKVNDKLWENTCAIRMSLALAGAGVFLPHGFLTVRAGKYKGRKLEIKQAALADFLCTLWGEPERFGAALLRERVRRRKGVIRFVGLWGPYDPQGHIDLMATYLGALGYELGCEGGHVYQHAVECWFWECPD